MRKSPSRLRTVARLRRDNLTGCPISPRRSSLTFSEKVIGYATAGKILRTLLGLAWGCLLFAIIAYGIALTYISMAGYHATNGTPFANYEQVSYLWITAGGATFVAGLAALIVAALMRHK